MKEAISMSAFFDKNSIYGIHNLYYEILGGRNPEAEKTPLMQEVEFLGFLTDSIKSPANHTRARELEERINRVFGSAKDVWQKTKSFPKEIQKFKNQTNKLAQMFYKLDPHMYPGKINHGSLNTMHQTSFVFDPIQNRYVFENNELNLDPNFEHYRKDQKKRILKDKVSQLRSQVQITQMNLRSDIGQLDKEVKDLLENASFLTRMTHKRLVAIQSQNKKLRRTLQSEGSQIYSIANDLH